MRYFFGKLCGTAPAQKANYAARCGKFWQNVWPLCGDFMQIMRHYMFRFLGFLE